MDLETDLTVSNLLLSCSVLLFLGFYLLKRERKKREKKKEEKERREEDKVSRKLRLKNYPNFSLFVLLFLLV